MKTFLIEDFSICHQCQGHQWCTLSCEYLRECLKTFETTLMVSLGAWGKLIHEKPEVKNLEALSLKALYYAKFMYAL